MALGNMLRLRCHIIFVKLLRTELTLNIVSTVEQLIVTLSLVSCQEVDGWKKPITLVTIEPTLGDILPVLAIEMRHFGGFVNQLSTMLAQHFF